MKATQFLINAKFARANNLPASFTAIRVRETQKAVWVYGHGSADPTGHCARCGRTLTHPGSILIGIGPECLGDWGARDIKMDNMNEGEKQYLRSLISSQSVDSWIPKSCIKSTIDVEEEILLPIGHKSIKTDDIVQGRSVGPPSVGQQFEKTQRTQTLVANQSNTPKTEVGKQAKEWKGGIAIQFPYSYDTLSKVKSLDGRKWHPEGKYWTCEMKVLSIRRLKEWGFTLDAFLENQLKGMDAHLELIGEDKVLSIGTLLAKSGIKRELFGFQREGVAFVESRKGRALIGDEMGLGKTIQALAYLQLHPEIRPAVIVCPASLKLNWAKEIKSTLNGASRIQIVEGKTPYRLSGEIIIINYDILEAWQKQLMLYKPKIIIADECHYFKSNEAKRTKAMKLLAKDVPHFIALSGTPIVNRPIEIYNALNIINSSVIPGFREYTKRYCGATYNGFGWDYSGATNTDELHKILTETIMIRRKKKDVLKDLPDKLYSFVPMTLSNIQEYDAIENDVIGYIRQNKGKEAAEKASNAEVLVQMELLKQAAVRGKMNASLDWIKDFLESGEKLVVFAIHKFVIDEIMKWFPNISVKIDGSTSLQDRNTAVERFQNDPKVSLFVGNIKAAGVGLTLTAASNVAILELPWTPGDLAQAEDRCHRIGQKDSVTVHMLLAAGTIEEDIASLLDIKRKILDAVLDGVVTQEESLLVELMNSLEKKAVKKANLSLQGHAINDALSLFK